MLRRAGFSNHAIFLLWSTVLAAGVVAAVAGKMFISNSDSTAAVLAQAVAGGAILALVTHAMSPEALHKGDSTVVLPARRQLPVRQTQKRRPLGRLFAI